jgi:hypothetical protein
MADNLIDDLMGELNGTTHTSHRSKQEVISMCGDYQSYNNPPMMVIDQCHQQDQHQHQQQQEWLMADQECAYSQPNLIETQLIPATIIINANNSENNLTLMPNSAITDNVNNLEANYFTSSQSIHALPLAPSIRSEQNRIFISTIPTTPATTATVDSEPSYVKFESGVYMNQQQPLLGQPHSTSLSEVKQQPFNKQARKNLKDILKSENKSTNANDLFKVATCKNNNNQEINLLSNQISLNGDVLYANNGLPVKSKARSIQSIINNNNNNSIASIINSNNFVVQLAATQPSAATLPLQTQQIITNTIQSSQIKSESTIDKPLFSSNQYKVKCFAFF